MPPPSPPQNPSSSSLHHGSAPRGPPTTSPFPGVRELSNHRAGMSISSILGGGEERKPVGSPHSSIAAPSSTSKSMQPPSPARARSASMREGSDRYMMKGASPPRPGIFAEPPRTVSEPRRDGIFGSPQFSREPAHGFRTYQMPPHDHVHHQNGHGVPPMRPNSQPVDISGPSRTEIPTPYDSRPDFRTSAFRNFGEPPPPQRAEPLPRQERAAFHNGVTSHPQERPTFGSPQVERAQPPMRYQAGSFGTPLREEQATSFRPSYAPTSHPTAEMARESIEGTGHDIRRQYPRPSPPPSELPAYERMRNGVVERPMTLDEHHRLEHQREQQRKESEGSVHRSLLGISPELNRRGRNSPLPQAVQGAQPRHIGPGGDNPGIKMEFGRMFSGLGSGVGSATPNPTHPAIGITTPSRMTPTRHLERGDLVQSAVVELDGRRSTSKIGARKNGRRPREEGEYANDNGRNTPDQQRGTKRAKANSHSAPHHHHHVHPHHHHHHHHEANENTAGPFNMMRFPSNPLSHSGTAGNPAHHHHHHHAHPGHHHHHPPRSAAPARRPSTTVLSKRVLDEVKAKPRKHLGSQLYTTELSLPSAAETPLDAKIKFSSKMTPIPLFEGKENCTFTIRVPRYYLTSSQAGAGQNCSFEEICLRRQLWGSEIYTDDSDVVAAAVHSGWLEGDFGEHNDDLKELQKSLKDDETKEAKQAENGDDVPLSLTAPPPKPVKVPQDHDAHITILILPPLESYASTHQNHVTSREWKRGHDGMSFMIHGIDFVDEGPSSRYAERGAAARKRRITMEEADRREAAAGLLLIANGMGAGAGTVRVGA
ncbi:Hypothetical predicted protein [Lecanosticta acicola]|uniref:Rxt3-domain-containing protein n=1 Tax=Lecanosticta acicola TaxID=111012 RepID=A0AAI9EA69_9PEZI|nr:Hypothetical predicted protein [Lecanosticta acicola]